LVKVLALRLVKLESPRRTDPDAVNLSAEGSWSGTPGYMAPEVVLGATDTDHRVDLYALGCVAYGLLTGTTVFEGENPVQVMIQHAQAEPKRPSNGSICPSRLRSRRS
jgi:eukaryotic-like serine/threonine-protein kinase